MYRTRAAFPTAVSAEVQRCDVVKPLPDAVAQIEGKAAVDAITFSPLQFPVLC
jgi:hypothetical protein